MIDYAAIRRTVTFARQQGWIWLDADRRDLNRLAFEIERLTAERDHWRAEYFQAVSGAVNSIKTDLLMTIKERLENGTAFNATGLSEEFDVSTKTIHRYVDLVREKFHLSLRWDVPRKTFVLEEAA